MLKKSSTISILLTAAIFILLEVAALSMVIHAGELQNIWVSRFSHSVMNTLWGSSESVREYFSLKGQNDALAQENYRLNLQVARLRQALGQQENSFEIVGEGDAGEFRYIPASIVKMSSNKQHNYLIVNKGYEDGVRAQSGVITSRGAIGIVEAVEKHYSYCISFMNSTFNVSARIGSQGVVGPMSWDGRSSNKAILHEIPLQTIFAQGDTVFTSGYSSIFPPDIPLGVITGSGIQDGTMYEINVTLLEDQAALRYVTIVDHTGRDEIIPLEQMEEGQRDEE
jgi:rod shape-determining protein MreC